MFLIATESSNSADDVDNYDQRVVSWKRIIFDSFGVHVLHFIAHKYDVDMMIMKSDVYIAYVLQKCMNLFSYSCC